MFVVVHWGVGPHGRVREFGGSSVWTQFFSLWFLPILPNEFCSVLTVREDSPEGPGIHVRIPLDGRSVFATYARSWGVLLLLVLAGYAIAGEIPPLLAAAECLALLLIVVAGFLLRRPLLRERVEALVYAEISGAPVDVAYMGEGGLLLRHQLNAYLEEHIGRTTDGYRDAPGVSRWTSRIGEVGSKDRALLVAAIGALRLDQALSRLRPDLPAILPDLRENKALHDHLWERLLALDPGLTQRAQADVYEPPTPSPALEWAVRHAPPFHVPEPPSRNPVDRPRPIPIRLSGALALVVGLVALVLMCLDAKQTGTINLLVVPPCLVLPVVGSFLVTFGEFKFTWLRGVFLLGASLATLALAGWVLLVA